MTELTDATFYAPLTTTLVPTNGTGNPTFTRATTKNVFDNNGKLKTVRSGSATLVGARCIQNITEGSSEILTGTRWLLGGAASRTDNSVTFTSGITDQIYQSERPPNDTASRTFTVSATLSTLSGTIQCRLKCSHGAVADYFSSNITVTTTPTRHEFTKTFSSAIGSKYLISGIINASPGNAGTVIISQFQSEDVTGQAIQTASEYVSVGVLSAPFQGAGVDGVKYFNTDSSAVAIPDATMLGAHIDPASKTNNLLYCRDFTNPNGVASRWSSSRYGSELSGTLTGTNASVSSGSAPVTWTATSSTIIYLNLGLTSVVGESYTLTLTIDSNATGNNISLANGSGVNYLIGSAPGTYTVTCRKNTSASTMRFYVSATSGQSVVISALSLKYSGTTVDLIGNGIDGSANSCSVLTAAAADATILQTITAASTPACSGFWVKRSVGTGSIYLTRDGGTTWTDIASLINSSTFSCVKIENTSVTNPQVGFKIATSGDAIIVDAGLNHAGTQLCEPIFTTTAAVTRNAEVLAYQTASNFSDTVGTILATFRPTYDTWPAGSIVGKSSFGLLTSTANSGVQAADGTNTVSGPTGTPSGSTKIGMNWTGSTMQAFSSGNEGVAGSYDGTFNLTTMAINPGVAGYIRDVAVWTSALSSSTINQLLGAGVASLVNIFNNDEAIQFFRDSGYPRNYNCGMLRWLRDYYGTSRGTLQDLLVRYIKEIS